MTLRRLAGLTEAGYAAFLARKFAPFPSVRPEAVRRLYPLHDFVDGQHAYETIASDIRVTCGILQLASEFGRALRSPVYHYVNEYRLSTPLALFSLCSSQRSRTLSIVRRPRCVC